jgi:transcriptional regulator with XRE-family HTH domain
MLAGVSIDYYTRLEQGRETNPSPQVVAALSRALALTPHQTQHLYALCNLLWEPVHDPRAGVDPTLLRMMESWSGSAAFVLDPLLDIIATNSLADALFAPFSSTRNLVEMVFLDPAGRSMYVDWDRAAESSVAALRATARFSSDDDRRTELLDALRTGSETFRDLWDRYDVHPKTQEQKTLFHPAVGEITIDFHTFGVSSMPGSELVVYQAEPGSESERRLRGLVVDVSDAVDAQPEELSA